MVKKIPETVNRTALLDEHYSIIFVTLRDFHLIHKMKLDPPCQAQLLKRHHRRVVLS